MGHFTCSQHDNKNSYFPFVFHYIASEVIVFTSIDGWLMKKRLTIFKGEAVHDGHPIEPVLVAGVSHREDAWAITQQRALQPAGDGACNHNGFLLF